MTQRRKSTGHALAAALALLAAAGATAAVVPVAVRAAAAAGVADGDMLIPTTGLAEIYRDIAALVILVVPQYTGLNIDVWPAALPIAGRREGREGGSRAGRAPAAISFSLSFFLLCLILLPLPLIRLLFSPYS